MIWGTSRVGLAQRICPQMLHCSSPRGFIWSLQSACQRESRPVEWQRPCFSLPSSSLLSYLAAATSVFLVSPTAPLQQHQLHQTFSRRPTLRCFGHGIFQKQKERGLAHEKWLLVGGRGAVLVYTRHTALVWGYEVKGLLTAATWLQCPLKLLNIIAGPREFQCIQVIFIDIYY